MPFFFLKSPIITDSFSDFQLFDIGTEGGEQESDGELLAETEEIPYECGPRQKYPMLFEEPMPLIVS